MRLPDSAHTSLPWRIHEVARGFRVEDVWALPTPGAADEFPRLVRLIAAWDPSRDAPAAVRALFAIRWRVGALLGWDGADAGAASGEESLRRRLPADLRAAPRGPYAGGLPFTSLYLLPDEWAAEILNRTMHGVVHVGWVPDGRGGHRGQLAVLVRRRGLLGAAYMAAIAPFRHVLVYPPALRELGRRWEAGAGRSDGAPAS